MIELDKLKELIEKLGDGLYKIKVKNGKFNITKYEKNVNLEEKNS
ncbi:MAG: hypothetical protein SOY60_06885 [Fusobacterium gastrosuis]|nr:hypothetical protein [Fusobacterium gastrosuis]